MNAIHPFPPLGVMEQHVDPEQQSFETHEAIYIIKEYKDSAPTITLVDSLSHAANSDAMFYWFAHIVNEDFKLVYMHDAITLTIISTHQHQFPSEMRQTSHGRSTHYLHIPEVRYCRCCMTFFRAEPGDVPHVCTRTHEEAWEAFIEEWQL